MSKAREVVKMIENEYAGMKEQSFTQRHFVAMANIIKELPDPISKQELVDRLVSMFKMDNPKFDTNRFKKAAGLGG